MRPFEKRFDRYLEYDFFEHQIHWFSIFNSFMMVVFLCGLVALILLRTLRNDFARSTHLNPPTTGALINPLLLNIVSIRYAKDEEIDMEGAHAIGEDSGWKQVHGDVFRAPDHLILFSALWGNGWQLVALVAGLVMLAFRLYIFI